ncbi:Retrovirus-related Pol polyprotein from transposon TNT 1-94 [Gossypium australe]|uniref:Retrovirus-related Pol polyprotein from transposon TNT 1-94 n=1 Tax=Gossypium australe TaxID=47621 RepID=A0A5B6VVU6_9ROSI|nr:Retrovirus-related Pol polyprotein from transposon TNT 1-94 [Gossypium australe]
MTPNKMFLLYLHTVTNSCFSARLENKSWLWHFCYGHLNFTGLKTLQQKNMVTSLPHIQTLSQVSEECVISKQHQEPFQKEKSWRARKALGFVHLDLCGPITPTSNGGTPIKVLHSDRSGEYN